MYDDCFWVFDVPLSKKKVQQPFLSKRTQPNETTQQQHVKQQQQKLPTKLISYLMKAG